jgi:hypothetical protein
LITGEQLIEEAASLGHETLSEELASGFELFDDLSFL